MLCAHTCRDSRLAISRGVALAAQERAYGFLRCTFSFYAGDVVVRVEEVTSLLAIFDVGVQQEGIPESVAPDR